MYNWLQELINDAKQFSDFAPGADETRITEVEEKLGIILPPSYCEFLLRWDGAKICSMQIFSCAKLLEYVEEECGFALYDGELRWTADSDKNYRHIYALKPTHFLAFCEPEYSSDLYCFDTSRTLDNEFLICKFSHDDDDLERLVRPEVPSFELWLMKKLYDEMDLVDLFLDDDLEEEAAESYLIERSEYWGDYLKKMLTAAGADMTVLPSQCWQAWRKTL
ncbi:SMI1/KNR4 family protein [Candidatus Venteria ishoeyi]|uniref:SMI1/KNR4 family protein n=1 Tax=Candidatus Venteria ishoeyi TaxID=1899563 RepID=UPI0025A629C7|nr:SMI1/KNR4 family protein [Candidatus Venteria ishoeyi]MDM8547758.1 SMI1/KNR4 family protein [Candidatus Venteria ishoeyi]